MEQTYQSSGSGIRQDLVDEIRTRLPPLILEALKTAETRDVKGKLMGYSRYLGTAEELSGHKGVNSIIDTLIRNMETEDIEHRGTDDEHHGFSDSTLTGANCLAFRLANPPTITVFATVTLDRDRGFIIDLPNGKRERHSSKNFQADTLWIREITDDINPWYFALEPEDWHNSTDNPVDSCERGSNNRHMNFLPDDSNNYMNFWPKGNEDQS